MSEAIEIIFSCLPFLCVAVPVIIGVIRGGRADRLFLFGWLAMVVSIAFFGIAGQGLAFAIEKELGYRSLPLFSDARGAVFMLFFGWIHAGVLVLLGMGIRKLALWKR